MERRRRIALQRSWLHEILDGAEKSQPPLQARHRVLVAQEIAERVAERLAPSQPTLFDFPPPGKQLLTDYRSME